MAQNGLENHQRQAKKTVSDASQLDDRPKRLTEENPLKYSSTVPPTPQHLDVSSFNHFFQFSDFGRSSGFVT
jgi:hypothetical protein